MPPRAAAAEGRLWAWLEVKVRMELWHLPYPPPGPPITCSSFCNSSNQRFYLLYNGREHVFVSSESLQHGYDAQSSHRAGLQTILDSLSSHIDAGRDISNLLLKPSALPNPPLLVPYTDWQTHANLDRRRGLTTIDKRVEVVEESVLRLLSTLKEGRNNLVPIYLLPNEILIDIWRTLDDSDIISLSKTCRRWRYATINSNLLWTTISTSMPVARTRTYIERSGNAPLRVQSGEHILAFGSAHELEQEEFEHLMPRIQSLKATYGKARTEKWS